LVDVYPELFSTLLVPKEPELVATPYRFGGSKAKAQQFFEEGLGEAFAAMRRAAHPAYPITVYYAFKQAETESEGTSSTGWETMLAGLIQAGFTITGTWPMRTERTARSVGLGTNALASSIILVCRPRPATAPRAQRREFLIALRQELPPALHKLQQGAIPPLDLQQASIGPGMAIYSRYTQVLDADGTPLGVRTALQLINQELDSFLSEQEGEFDSDTRWAITWFEQYGFAAGPYGEAETLCTAKNTSMAGLVQAGLLQMGGGKVRLLAPQELPAEWNPAADERLTVWELTHQIGYTLLERGGEQAAARLMAASGSKLEPARDLAYRLYTICERKGWSQEGLLYNVVAASWLQTASQVSGVAQQMRLV
jgi:putative DNA methylase